MYDHDQPERVEPLLVHLTGSDVPMTQPPRPRPRRGISTRTYTLTSDDPVQQILPLNARRCDAWIQPLATDITIGPSKADVISGGGGTARLPGAAGGDSVSATAIATGDNTTGGQAFVTIPATSLPAGRYKIDIYSQMPTITNPATSNNVRLQAGSTAVVTLIEHIVAQNSGAYQAKDPLTVYRYLDGKTALTLNWAANMAATETQVWNATLVATPVGAPETGPFPIETTDAVWATAASLPAQVTVVSVIEEF